MTYNVMGIEYKNLDDFMITGAPLPLQIYLESEEEINDAINNNFQGIYTATLYDLENNPISSYEFVYIDEGIDDNNEEFFWMKPMYFPDDLFLKYFLGESTSDGIDDFIVHYNSFEPSKYKTKENELLDYNGNIRPIKEGELFIQDKGINYLVENNNLDEIKKQGDMVERNYFEELINCQEAIGDNYQGIFVVNYVYYTGEHLSSKYMVNQINEDNVVFNTIEVSPINGFNTPEYILVEENGKNIVKMLRTFKSYEYIPSSEL